MEVIVHYPETAEEQAFLEARVAKFHTQYVAEYLEKLNCSTEQKMKLIDAIAQKILENCTAKKSHT